MDETRENTDTDVQTAQRSKRRGGKGNFPCIVPRSLRRRRIPCYTCRTMPKRDGTPTKREHRAKLATMTLEDRAQAERERRAKREAERAELERLRREAEAERIAERAALEEARRDTLLRDGPDAVLRMPATTGATPATDATDTTSNTRGARGSSSRDTRDAIARDATSRDAHARDAHARAPAKVDRTPRPLGQTENLPPTAPAFSDVSSTSDEIRWVMENLHADDVCREDAPSASAWGMWCWARRDAKSADAFVTQVYGKAFVAKDSEESSRRDRRSAVELDGLIERCLRAAAGAKG